MEPNRAGVRLKRMPADTTPLRADTATIHAFGRAQTACAADLTAAAAAINSVAPPALGPVGARFVTAFNEAVAEHSAAVRALGQTAQSAGVVAHHNGAGYDAAVLRAGLMLPQV